MKTLKDFNFQGKRVLLRTDFNVPLNEKGDILDDFRIKAAMPTIEYLTKNRAKIIIISHLGRPSGRPNPKSEIRNPKQIPKFKIQNSKHKKYSLKPVAKRLEKLLKKKIKFLDDCIGKEVKKEIAKMKVGDVVLLENIRFYKEEEENNPQFAEELVQLGDIYINDAFAVCHRSHASITSLPKFLLSGIGFSVEKEIKALEQLALKPKKPLIAIIGGAKAKTKVKLINKLSEIADYVLIGHLIQKEIKQENIQLENPQKIIEPIDALVENGKDLDIGPKTIQLFQEKISQAKTIFWNGPFGKIEEKKFSQGTLVIAKAILKSEAYSVIGGGDTNAFLDKYNLRDGFSFISTGGGAMLDYLVDGKLVGIEVLRSGI